MWVCVCVYVLMEARRECLDTLELALQAALSHPIWAVGTYLKPSRQKSTRSLTAQPSL